MIAIASAALVGGLPTAALLWPHGPMVALLGAPFGGSMAALAMAVTIAATRHAAQDGEDAARPAPARSARRAAYAWSR